MSVVLVEDDHFLRIQIKKILNGQLSCEFFLASNGLEGLDLIRQYNPRVVITDINMPVMNGLDLIKEIKPWFTGLIIAISADNENLSKAKKNGADYVLEKGTPELIDGMISILQTRF